MTRRCGQCTLCCRLTPVPEIRKPGGTRCTHQRMGKGCAIYAKRPMACRMWSCRWLVEEDTADQRRPDLSHCVIDISPDFVTMRDDTTGAATNIPVVQIWVDPRHPGAWEATEIMDFIERRGREGFGAIIRYNEVDAVVVFPPAVSQKHFGQAAWFRRSGPGMRETSHDQHQIAAALTEALGEEYAVGMPQKAQAALTKLFRED
jgi:hypothetical protein